MGVYNSLPISTRTGNPYLDEIDQAAGNAHAALSPGAQLALRKAGAPVPISDPQAPRITSPKNWPPPSIKAQVDEPMSENMPNGQPAMTAAIGTPRPIPQVQPQSPQEQAQIQGLNRITAPDTGQHDRANTGTSGINQIHNPWGRVPLQILEAIGTGFAPGLTSAIPGTQLHHNMLVNQAEGGIKQQEDLRKRNEEAGTAAATQGHSEAETGLENAQAAALGEESKKNTVTLGPGQGVYDLKTHSWLVEPSATDNEKVTEVDPEIGKQLGIAPTKDGRFLVPNQALGALLKKKEPTEGEMPLGNRVQQLNNMLTTRYQVLHPKAPLPAQYQIPPNATQKDYDRIDKGLEAEERAIGTKEQQAQTNEMRRQTLSLAQANAQNRQDTAIRTAGFKAYTPALESAERFNVMARNYEDAVKNHDQQAMLSLLANHLGMTMGLQKGSRLTKDIIHEAETSRPWLQGLQAKFDSNGYLSGVNLTPDQMRQMVNLGRERFSEDATRARSEATYQGVQDQGPARIPNRSTINHYTALANGDAKKAKELAAADGWTVQ